MTVILKIKNGYGNVHSRLNNEPGSTPNFHQMTPREFTGSSLILIYHIVLICQQAVQSGQTHYNKKSQEFCVRKQKTVTMYI